MPVRYTTEGDSQYHCVQLFPPFLFPGLFSTSQMISYVFRQGDLPKLDVQLDRGSDFTAWIAQWESYMNLSGLADESNKRKVQALTLCFSRKTLHCPKSWAVK